MRIALLIVLLSPQSVAAATFVGQTSASFWVNEYYDGTGTSVQKFAPLSVTLSTDYRAIEWTLSFDVDLLMAGGPDQPFETWFRARGEITTDGPSDLTFPDASGVSSAGQYRLGGWTEWILRERIVDAVTTHESGLQSVGHFGGPDNHSLSVRKYPESVELRTNLMSISTWLSLGQITYSPDNYIRARILEPLSPYNIVLREVLPGDFNDSGVVDAADYTVWRDSPGIMSPILTSYDSWKSNFGKSAGSGSLEQVAVPEPTVLRIICVAVAALAMLAPNRVRECL